MEKEEQLSLFNDNEINEKTNDLPIILRELPVLTDEKQEQFMKKFKEDYEKGMLELKRHHDQVLEAILRDLKATLKIDFTTDEHIIDEASALAKYYFDIGKFNINWYKRHVTCNVELGKFTELKICMYFLFPHDKDLSDIIRPVAKEFRDRKYFKFDILFTKLNPSSTSIHERNAIFDSSCMRCEPETISYSSEATTQPNLADSKTGEEVQDHIMNFFLKILDIENSYEFNRVELVALQTIGLRWLQNYYKEQLDSSTDLIDAESEFNLAKSAFNKRTTKIFHLLKDNHRTELLHQSYLIGLEHKNRIEIAFKNVKYWEQQRNEKKTE